MSKSKTTSSPKPSPQVPPPEQGSRQGTAIRSAGVECKKPNHDKTTIKLTSIKMGSNDGQASCPNNCCRKTKKSQFKMTQRRKKASSERPK
jgi:hypothetical protein